MGRKRNLFPGFSICFFSVFLLTAGCAAVHSDPFAEFTSSLRQVETGADMALRYLDAAGRDRFVQEIAEASQSAEGFEAVQTLLFAEDGEADSAGERISSRLLTVSPRFRSGVHTLNRTLVAYSQLLGALAGAPGVSPTRFGERIQNLNADMLSAAAALQLENSEQIGGMDSADAYRAASDDIDQKKRGRLRKVLEENQPMIACLSSRLREAIRAAVEELQAAYDANSVQLARELRPDLTVGLEARKRTVSKLLALNDDFRTRSEILERLDDVYRLLPEAHAELILSMEKRGCGLAAVNELCENGKQMCSRYRALTAFE